MMITREKVEDVLLRMGMSVNLKGFGYIRDSVLMLDAEKDIKLTYLYFKIAKVIPLHRPGRYSFRRCSCSTHAPASALCGTGGNP